MGMYHKNYMSLSDNEQENYNDYYQKQKQENENMMVVNQSKMRVLSEPDYIFENNLMSPINSNKIMFQQNVEEEEKSKEQKQKIE